MEKVEKRTIKPDEEIIQKKVLSNYLKNGGNMTEAVRELGIYKAPQSKARALKKSYNFRHLLDAAGLSDRFLNKALYEDIRNKPGDRLGELTLAYKLRGHMREKQEGNKTLILMTSGESASRFKIREHGEESNDDE
jgi:hypothetical protein